jgi:ABC-type phosphate/phosphonate transport system substrate-binding protein
MIPPLRHFSRSLIAAWLLCATVAASAQTPSLLLIVEPLHGENETRRAFQPLADYLNKRAGVGVTIVAKSNFFSHWETVRRGTGYDLVLDDAHFTDYRVQKFGFIPLVKFPGNESYSLVVAAPKTVSDPLQLAGKKIASFGPPSIGAMRLNAMFPNPARRPAIIEVTSAEDGLRMLMKGQVQAAILPTSVVGSYLAHGNIALLATSEPTPHMALSVAAHVSPNVREKIRDVLLRADKSPDSKQLLQGLGVEYFELATPAIYANQARMLRDFWGY